MWHRPLIRITLAAAFLGIGGVTTAFAQVACPDPSSDEVSYGPYDYTNPQHRSERLPIVEQYHFTDDIEHLRRDSTRSLGQNIAYVLNRFPNHHRALRSMTLLVQRTGSERPAGMERTLDCWFSRARAFQPDDGVVPMIYGMHYYSQGEYEKAVEKMQEGLELEPDNRNIHYNIALAYMELERYEKAREHAKEAYNRNFPLDGLRRKLQAAGEWE